MDIGEIERVWEVEPVAQSHAPSQSPSEGDRRGPEAKEARQPWEVPRSGAFGRAVDAR